MSENESLNNFEDVLFPEDISYGATATTIFNNDVIVVESGFEKRTINWVTAKHTFNVSHNVKSEEQVHSLNEMYYSMIGRAISFKFKNWADYKCYTNKGIANKDGQLTGLPFVQLFKKYQYKETMNRFYSRKIELIATDREVEEIDFQCFLDEQELHDFELDKLKGRVYFEPIKKVPIVSVSKGLNAVITTIDDHNFEDGDKIYISNVANMEMITEKLFEITKIDEKSFSVNYDTSLSDFNGTGGFASFYPQRGDFKWCGEFFFKVRFSEDTATTTIDNFNSFSFPCGLTEVED